MYLQLLEKFLPVFSNTSCMLLHGCIRAHPIEEFHLLAILFYNLSSTLIVACKHPSKHDKISTGSCDQQSDM